MTSDPQAVAEETREACSCRHDGPCRESECGHPEYAHAQPSPAGPEEPREGHKTHVCQICRAEWAATPVPDTGAEERLRAALRLEVLGELHWALPALRDPEAMRRFIEAEMAALSGGSVDEGTG